MSLSPPPPLFFRYDPYGNRIPPPTLGWKLKRGAQVAAIGFGMGGFVGSVVVLTHNVLNGGGQRGVGKAMMATGMSMGTIFAVGNLLREVGTWED
eukprot:gb/GEZN01016793.1/.p1 GENE.gb/GEZN01016793.1/~~gb/GEZN01016793.1/.p1  ORF type:complete len:106 (+),score=15.10 gb/GEZN01016793.1/:34-318(+)